MRAVAIAALLSATALTALPAHADDRGDEATDLHLVTLRGPGTAGHRGPAAPDVVAQRMLAHQSVVLDDIAAGAPV
jgi:minor extracellular serine protease Vpr